MASKQISNIDYVYQRPKHDLRHRQDADAVASATHVLETLQKRGLLDLGSVSSMEMNATFTPIPSWQRTGSDGDAHGKSPQLV